MRHFPGAALRGDRAKRILFATENGATRLKILRTSAFATLAVFVVSMGAPSARASFVTGTITGQVISTGGAVPGITVGSTVSGSYTYDTSVTVGDILGPVNPFTAFSLTIGAIPHVFSLADLQTGGVVTPGVVPGNSTPTVNELFFFFDPTVVGSSIGATVAQQSISNNPPQSYFVTTTDAAHSFGFSFSAPAAVPEPSSLGLMGIAGVAGLAIARVLRGRRPGD